MKQFKSIFCSNLTVFGFVLAAIFMMVPLGDILGVSRQVAVQAFLYGDGFANMIVPTNPVLMGILGMAGVSYNRWFRFCLPLLLKLLAFAAVAIVGMVVFGFS